MANIKANIKANRQSKKKFIFNKIMFNKLNKQIKLAKKNKNAMEVAKTYKIADSLAAKKIIHKNKASNIKAKVAKLLKSKK